MSELTDGVMQKAQTTAAEFDAVKKQVDEANSSIIVLTTKKEELVKRAQEILKKYGVATVAELQGLRDASSARAEAEMTAAKKFVADTEAVVKKVNEQLAQVSGVA